MDHSFTLQKRYKKSCFLHDILEMPANLEEEEWNHATNLFYQLIGHKFSEGAILNGLTILVKKVGIICFYLHCSFTLPNNVNISQEFQHDNACPVFDYLMEGDSVYPNVV